MLDQIGENIEENYNNIIDEYKSLYNLNNDPQNGIRININFSYNKIYYNTIKYVKYRCIC